MAKIDTTISILNNLIISSKEDEQGFARSAEDVQDLRIKEFFIRRSQKAAICVAELQDLVDSLGGMPADAATMSSRLHWKWMDLKNVISCNDKLAVLNKVELEENKALNAYRQAAEKHLPSFIREVIVRQLDIVQDNYYEVVKLKNNLNVMAN